MRIVANKTDWRRSFFTALEADLPSKQWVECIRSRDTSLPPTVAFYRSSSNPKQTQPSLWPRHASSPAAWETSSRGLVSPPLAFRRGASLALAKPADTSRSDGHAFPARTRSLA
jgi:hypothetical protein